MIGAIAVGVLSWLAFCATSVLAALHVWRTRRGGAEGSGVGGKVHGGWVGMGKGMKGDGATGKV